MKQNRSWNEWKYNVLKNKLMKEKQLNERINKLLEECKNTK